MDTALPDIKNIALALLIFAAILILLAVVFGASGIINFLPDIPAALSRRFAGG